MDIILLACKMLARLFNSVPNKGKKFNSWVPQEIGDLYIFNMLG